MAAFEAWLVFLILVVNVVGELQRKRTLAASRGFLAAARLSCSFMCRYYPLLFISSLFVERYGYNRKGSNIF